MNYVLHQPDGTETIESLDALTARLHDDAAAADWFVRRQDSADWLPLGQVVADQQKQRPPKLDEQLARSDEPALPPAQFLHRMRLRSAYPRLRTTVDRVFVLALILLLCGGGWSVVLAFDIGGSGAGILMLMGGVAVFLCLILLQRLIEMLIDLADLLLIQTSSSSHPL